MSYGVVLADKVDRTDGVLVILEEREEAEAIAFAVRRKGYVVEVRRLPDDPYWPARGGDAPRVLEARP